jgi:hypothetical protein
MVVLLVIAKAAMVMGKTAAQKERRIAIRRARSNMLRGK